MKITIDAVHISRTYAGVLEGRPSRTEIIGWIKRDVEKMWGGGRPLLFLEPSQPLGMLRDKPDLADTEPLLPEWRLCAWLSGPPKNPDGFGSHLIVAWFEDKLDSFHFPALLLGPEDWNQYAKDWEP